MEKHVPFKHRRTTLERAEKFISTHHFTDINLRSRLYPARKAVTSLTHYAAPGRISYEEAMKGKYTPAKIGQSFGPTWATHWFKVEVEVPADWVGQEVRLVWNSNTEALVWVDGKPVQGLSSEKDRYDFVLSSKQEKGQLRYTVYVEMACNGLFGAGQNSMIGPTDPDKHFTLQQVDIVTFDRDVYGLILDMEILYGMAKELPDSDRGYQALYAANDFVNACDVQDKKTYKRAKEISEKFFSQRNGDTQHTIHAVGHSHIDTAWLWPYDETKRKCARSWSCTIGLMEQYPDFKFACSQAQQYAWIKELYPSLYKDICKFVAKGQFIPVGGTWIEMDGYVPSGEAFVRQFLYGQRFFQKEFGIKCSEFWLPDTFGYAAQLPQIMRESGITRFVTQKMSWNLVNKFPHHTFWWEGVDGSRVLSHFPPGDSYHLEGHVKEVLYTANNFRDKGRSSSSLFLFGYGDGGNGPDEHMLQRLKRMEDIDGLPRVKMSTPDEFFKPIEEKEADKLCTWRGELYLEMHNGTYTTHAKVKERNRHCEFLLQEVEQAWALLVALGRAGGGKGEAGKAAYPSNAIERLWKLLLLNQFHDVLPGSSISIVYDDAHRFYKEIEDEGKQLLSKAVSLLGNALGGKSEKSSTLLVNSLGWQRSVVVPLPVNDTAQPSKRRKTQSQTDSQGNTLVCVEVPSCSVGGLESCVKDLEETESVHVEKQGEFIILRNKHVQAKLDSSGRLTSLRCAGSSRELLLEGCPGNQLLLYDDVPLYWDAWDVMDYHLETRKPLEQVTQKATVKESGPLRASIDVKTRISAESTVTQTIYLDAGSSYITFDTQVEWHENRKFLKVEFPTNIHSMEATYETQYGALQRPNHYNTSWDSARYEVCGQKWADLSEHGAGLSVLTDSKYGYSAVGGVLRISLLRSPKAPDAHADMGTHNFRYAVMPHRGSWQEAGTVQAAFNLNRPVKVFPLAQGVAVSQPRSFFWLDSSQVVLDTVKMAEDRPDEVMMVRLYEAFGGRAEVTLSSSLPLRSAGRCNCLEEAQADGDLPIKTEGGVATIPLKLRPFQILTLALTL
ncbi:alpha-mannosidase 2C1-like isoform X1 [Littorina saxatilis]|uniref:alpha-mannosidase 2C1-like isoform X1 n=1 Tax=Littorina saxatilis TaxID=31220 RepID=UPI0038B693FF